MKKKFFIVLTFLALCLCCFLIYVYFNDGYRFHLEYEMYNYLPYENGKYIKVDVSKKNKVVYLEEKDISSFLESGTGVLYFGYSDCPWCRNIVSPLVRVTNKNKYSLYYVNVRKIKDSSKLLDYLDDYLEKDDNGKKRLYVPDVYFVKNGKILSHHLSAVDGYYNAFFGMNDEQLKELEKIYQEGIDLIRKEE